MKISIIVPIYKVEDYLNRCLDSFLNNNTKDFEVIMVDDGSPDTSGLIADEYEIRYANYHSYHKDNGGLSDARNYGLEKASGEYIWFVDSDDYITNGALDKFVELNSRMQADVYCFAIEKSTEQRIETITYKSYNGVKNGYDFLIYQFENGYFQPEAWRNIYKKTLLINNNCYFTPGLLHEDEEWTPRTIINAKNVVVSSFVSYTYVVRENSIMKQSNLNRHIESIKRMIDNYEKNDFGFDSKLKKLILDRFINNYISCFSKGQFYCEKCYYLPYSYFKNKIYFPRTRIKVWLFCFNKKLFCKLSKFINK